MATRRFNGRIAAYVIGEQVETGDAAPARPRFALSALTPRLILNALSLPALAFGAYMVLQSGVTKPLPERPAPTVGQITQAILGFRACPHGQTLSAALADRFLSMGPAVPLDTVVIGYGEDHIRAITRYRYRNLQGGITWDVDVAHHHITSSDPLGKVILMNMSLPCSPFLDNSPD